MTARRRLVVVCTLLAVVWVVRPDGARAAHPGHGAMALVGTLTSVSADDFTLDVRDVASGVVTRLRVGIGTDTRLRVRKETIASLTPWIGASVVATVDYEEGPDGQTVYHATKVQVTPPKTKR